MTHLRDIESNRHFVIVFT